MKYFKSLTGKYHILNGQVGDRLVANCSHNRSAEDCEVLSELPDTPHDMCGVCASNYTESKTETNSYNE